VTDPQKVNPDGLYELIGAIVRQAMHDYEFALRGKRQLSQDKRTYSPEEMERWFQSEYGQMLCAGRGEAVIELCRENVAKLNSGGRKRCTGRPRYFAEKEENQLKITLEVDCDVSNVQITKEELAKHLESLGNTKVLKVREVLPEKGGRL
jgi:hypothetical protein